MGVETKIGLQALNAGFAKSAMTDSVIPQHVLTRNFAGGQSLSNIGKDVILSSQLAARYVPKQGLLSDTLSRLDQAIRAQPRDLDYTILAAGTIDEV